MTCEGDWSLTMNGRNTPKMLIRFHLQLTVKLDCHQLQATESLLLKTQPTNIFWLHPSKLAEEVPFVFFRNPTYNDTRHMAL